MNWDSFKHMFHKSWHPKIKEFIESTECDKIYAFLKEQSKSGKKLAPLSMNTFKCFLETPLDELTVVLMGNSPYNILIDDTPLADGFLLGCSGSLELQFALQKFYDGLEVELYNGLHVTAHKNPDVRFLANQGVLMLNASLTTEIGSSMNHMKIWEPFIAFLYREIINRTKVPTIFLGEDVSVYKKYLNPRNEYFILDHPGNTKISKNWDTLKVFSKVNDIIFEDQKDMVLWLDIDCPF